MCYLRMPSAIYLTQFSFRRLGKRDTCRYSCVCFYNTVLKCVDIYLILDTVTLYFYVHVRKVIGMFDSNRVSSP